MIIDTSWSSRSGILQFLIFLLGGFFRRNFMQIFDVLFPILIFIFSHSYSKILNTSFWSLTASSSKTVRNCTRTWISYETIKIVGNRSEKRNFYIGIGLDSIENVESLKYSAVSCSFFFLLLLSFHPKSLFSSNRVKYFHCKTVDLTWNKIITLNNNRNAPILHLLSL